MSTGAIIAIVVLVVLVAVAIALLFFLLPLKEYFKARFSGAKVPLKDLIKIKNAKESIWGVLSLYTSAQSLNINMSIDDILEHKHMGGSVDAVLRALTLANNANISLPVALAKAIDLSGKNVVESVQLCLTPKIVPTQTITAIAKDGIQIKMKLNLTLRTNLKRILSGAVEETITARVEEACISAIGSANSHSVVVQNPDAIAESIMQKDLDSGSMYEIVSVDCISCEVGENVKARLAAEEAESQKRIKVAQYEEEKAKQLVKEQEAKIKVQEMKAELARQEAEVPKAFVDALNEGKLSAMDYLTIENLKSDTAMRNAITKNSTSKQEFDDNDDFDF